MKKLRYRYFIVFLFCQIILPVIIYASIINGTIRDDCHLHPLGNIAVSIYLEADSTLIATDTTGESGSFHLHWSTLSINNDLETPSQFQLYPNYPNFRGAGHQYILFRGADKCIPKFCPNNGVHFISS